MLQPGTLSAHQRWISSKLETQEQGEPKQDVQITASSSCPPEKYICSPPGVSWHTVGPRATFTEYTF